MIIAGLDLSLTSSGLVKFHLDENYYVTKTEYNGFTSTKSIQSDLIHYYHKNQFKNNTDKASWMIPIVETFIKDADYVAFEGYAYGAKGHVFDLAEFAGVIKYNAFNAYKALRIYPPSSVKKYFAKNGLADKISMYRAYEEYICPYKFSINHLPKVTDGKKGASPTGDIVDAFAICDLLYTELLLRHGKILLKNLDTKVIEVFNAVDKKNDNNLLVRDFIKKVK
jgi:hypothetical protein